LDHSSSSSSWTNPCLTKSISSCLAAEVASSIVLLKFLIHFWLLAFLSLYSFFYSAVIYFIIPLLFLIASCLALAPASLAFLAVSLVNLALGFNLNNALFEVKGFFFYLKCWCSTDLAALITDWTSFELIILAKSALVINYLCI